MSYRGQVAAFLEEYGSWAEPHHLQRNQAWWQASALGDLHASQQVSALDARWLERHADARAYSQLRMWLEDPGAGSLPRVLRRQLQLAALAYARAQQDPRTIERTTQLEQELRDGFNSFRAELDHQPADDNALDQVLREERSSSRLRDAWNASKQIGGLVADRLLELVRLRNQAAAEQGYASDWERRLSTSEIAPAELLALMERIAADTAEPFQAEKAALDRALSMRYGVTQ